MLRRILVFSVGVAAMAAVAGYQNEIEEWRRSRVERLKADGGWLTVAGLFWLHEGTNTVGKDAGNDIVLPDGPAKAGTFELKNGKVTATFAGSTREIKHDSADVAKIGRLSLFVIKRSDKWGIRLKDPDSEYRKAFHGIENYPINEHYRVTAKWVAQSRQIPILNILGQTEPSENPGYAL